ncbi:MAG: hypothetical protein Q9M91_02480 [Candidatus Dojkabacteria bacterium]|nr:hypothetical protein [Candidatus Dojkabacteria bacterium]MDQ7020692.1 hypothetical protein [Candidatus Dojkabacteria bacterium]
MKLLPEFDKTRFGIETVLNSYFNSNDSLKVSLIGLHHPMKYQKDKDFSKYAKEYFDVISEILQTQFKIKFKKFQQSIIDLASNIPVRI